MEVTLPTEIITADESVQTWNEWRMMMTPKVMILKTPLKTVNKWKIWSMVGEGRGAPHAPVGVFLVDGVQIVDGFVIVLYRLRQTWLDWSSKRSPCSNGKNGFWA